MAEHSIDAEFCQRLPKIELHAHLTGSISPQTLQELWKEKMLVDSGCILEDPVKVMSNEHGHFDVRTFFPLFDDYVYELVNDTASVTLATRAVLYDFLNDGVCYLELRTTPRIIRQEANGKAGYVSTVIGAITRFMDETDSAMPTYLILSIDRKQSLEEAMETVEMAIRYRDLGHRIVGVDLCGNPARAINDLRPAFVRAKKAGLKVTLHFAEIPASSSRKELDTLLSFEPDRLGHVIHVPEDLRAAISEKSIGVELCLSCNVLAGMTEGGYGNHHFGDWNRLSSPIALSTDDVGVFGSPLSDEYLLAAEHFHLSKEDLFGLVRSASRAIFAGRLEAQRIEGLVDAFENEPH